MLNVALDMTFSSETDKMDRKYLCINISVTDLYQNRTKCTKAIITSKMHNKYRLPVDSTFYRLSRGRYAQRSSHFENRIIINRLKISDVNPTCLL